MTVIDTVDAVEPVLISTVAGVSKHDIASMVTAAGALQLNDHFELKCGEHSTAFLQFGALSKYPAYIEGIAEMFAQHLEGVELDCVVVPNTSAAVLGFELALRLDASLSLVNPDLRGYPEAFAPNFQVPRGKRVLLVTDVVTTGETLRLLRGLCDAADLKVVGAAAFATRGPILDTLPGIADLSVRVMLAQFDLPRVPEEDCDACRCKVPLKYYYTYHR